MIELRLGRNESRRLTGTRYRAGPTIKTRILSLAATEPRDRVKSETKVEYERKGKRCVCARAGGKESWRGKRKRCGVTFFSPLSSLSSVSSTLKVSPTAHSYLPYLSSRFFPPLLAPHPSGSSPFEFFFFFHSYTIFTIITRLFIIIS